MVKNPKDGGRYRDSVRDAKKAGKMVARKAEKMFHLPVGSVRICITRMTAGQRDKLAEKAA